MRQVDEQLRKLENWNKSKLEKVEASLKGWDWHRASTLKEIDSFFQEVIEAAERR